MGIPIFASVFQKNGAVKRPQISIYTLTGLKFLEGKKKGRKFFERM